MTRFLNQYEPVVSIQFFLELEDEILKSGDVSKAIRQFMRNDYIFQEIFQNHTNRRKFAEQRKKEVEDVKSTTDEGAKEAANTWIKEMEKKYGIEQVVALQALARVLRCASVNVFSTKYCLPVSICNSLLFQLDFEEELLKNIQTNTLYHFGKRCKHEISVLYEKNVNFDFIVYRLQDDLKTFFEEVEKKFLSLQKLSSIIQRMNFEISGYLKQTVVAEVKKRFCENLNTPNIETKLREDLLE